jgi:acetyl esterase/lipase
LVTLPCLQESPCLTSRIDGFFDESTTLDSESTKNVRSEFPVSQRRKSVSTDLEGKHFAPSTKTAFHPIAPEDKTAMTAMRAIAEPNKGRLAGTAARVPFDAIMESVAVPEGVAFEAGTVGGIHGWWCRPQAAHPGAVVLHIHGGWFNWGSAKAFRNLVGHIATHVGVVAFAPDYRLAPEHPFPAALEDVRACHSGLFELGYNKIAVTGDSAGGNLALELLISLKASHSNNTVVPVAGVALSPVTDLSLSGASWTTRAAADPYFTRPQATELVRSYLNEADPSNPSASPLYADLADLPPVRVHVGDDEVLLDDSVHFVDRALAAGVDAQLDVWEGMVHVFLGNVGRLSASAQALEQIGTFLSKRFA